MHLTFKSHVHCYMRLMECLNLFDTHMQGGNVLFFNMLHVLHPKQCQYRTPSNTHLHQCRIWRVIHDYTDIQTMYIRKTYVLTYPNFMYTLN